MTSSAVGAQKYTKTGILSSVICLLVFLSLQRMRFAIWRRWGRRTPKFRFGIRGLRWVRCLNEFWWFEIVSSGCQTLVNPPSNGLACWSWACTERDARFHAPSRRSQIRHCRGLALYKIWLLVNIGRPCEGHGVAPKCQKDSEDSEKRRAGTIPKLVVVCCHIRHGYEVNTRNLVFLTFVDFAHHHGGCQKTQAAFCSPTRAV